MKWIETHKILPSIPALRDQESCRNNGNTNHVLHICDSAKLEIKFTYILDQPTAKDCKE